MTEQKSELTIDVLIKHYEKLIQDCEKLPLEMSMHVQRNQYFSALVKKLKEEYDLVKKPEEPKPEVKNGKDKAK